jgi:uncharacterized protein DUF1579
MARRSGLPLAASVLLLAFPVLAAEPPKMTPEMEAMMKAGTPGPQHQELGAMAGDYDVKIKMWEAAGAPPTESTGTVKRTMMLDGRVLAEEFHSDLMGMPFTGHAMMGYDNTKAKYWSTWMDNMSTGMMTSEGTCDAKKKCTFKGTSIDPLKKKPVTYKMTTTWSSSTTELFEMYGPDSKSGKEMKMMEITYTKK